MSSVQTPLDVSHDDQAYMCTGTDYRYKECDDQVLGNLETDIYHTQVKEVIRK